jgi:molybdate transport system substrate-binding protein
MRTMSFIILSCLLSLGCSSTEEPLLIFAAASTRDALDEVLTQWDGPPVTVSYAASSTLARQIEAGAPAHVFLSAHPHWMDHVEERGLTVDVTRRDLLANGLVLVVPGAPGDDAPPTAVDIDLSARMGDGVFAMGDPDHVPVGIYGRAALEHLGWWNDLAPRIARGFDTRAALAFVERGEAPLGLVYATDAAVSDRVAVLATIPPDAHPPITYPVAAVGDHRSDDVDRLLEHLASPGAMAIFARYGFLDP